MNKVLVYKCADGSLSESYPSPKADVQRDLSAVGKKAWINQINSALAFETERNNADGIAILEQRLAWVSTVNDFDNLTDAEFQSFIETTKPQDSQYHHWIDKIQMPKDRTYRDAWKDVAIDGTIALDDTIKAKIDIEIAARASVAAASFTEA